MWASKTMSHGAPALGLLLGLCLFLVLIAAGHRLIGSLQPCMFLPHTALCLFRKKVHGCQSQWVPASSVSRRPLWLNRGWRKHPQQSLHTPTHHDYAETAPYCWAPNCEQFRACLRCCLVFMVSNLPKQGSIRRDRQETTL
uniref:Putative secreted protein n=1 Tax=Amblyomma cajennense TaxID=34607 RepID=A0A023FE38_AMBCJ